MSENMRGLKRPNPNSTGIVRQTRETWQGPLPPPKALEEFRALVPDAPERIFRQWEGEAAHRRDYETKALRAAILKDRLGQTFAGLFSIAALGLVGFAIWMNQPWVAAILGGGTIGTVVGAFLYERRTPRP